MSLINLIMTTSLKNFLLNLYLAFYEYETVALIIINRTQQQRQHILLINPKSGLHFKHSSNRHHIYICAPQGSHQKLHKENEMFITIITSESE